jgi:hypothetical protein
MGKGRPVGHRYMLRKSSILKTLSEILRSVGHTGIHHPAMDIVKWFRVRPRVLKVIDLERHVWGDAESVVSSAKRGHSDKTHLVE